MKLSYALILILIFAGLSFKADAAEQGLYVQGSLYGNDLTDTEVRSGGVTADYDSDIGIGTSAELGYKFNDHLRASAELAYRHNDVSAGTLKGEFESYAAMGNLYIDIPTGGKLTPYIGGGAGYAYVTDTDVDDSVFAYQGMAGLNYAATDKLDIVLGYKYFGTTTPNYSAGGVNIEAPYKSHNIELGVRYTF